MVRGDDGHDRIQVLPLSSSVDRSLTISSVEIIVLFFSCSFFQVSQNVVISPALKIPMSAFSGILNQDDIEMDILPPSLMHPAAQNYFFRRVNDLERFDPKLTHPAFFNSDYERFGTRHVDHSIQVQVTACASLCLPMRDVMKKWSC